MNRADQVNTAQAMTILAQCLRDALEERETEKKYVIPFISPGTPSQLHLPVPLYSSQVTLDSLVSSY